MRAYHSASSTSSTCSGGMSSGLLASISSGVRAGSWKRLFWDKGARVLTQFRQRPLTNCLPIGRVYRDAGSDAAPPRRRSSREPLLGSTLRTDREGAPGHEEG